MLILATTTSKNVLRLQNCTSGRVLLGSLSARSKGRFAAATARTTCLTFSSSASNDRHGTKAEALALAQAQQQESNVQEKGFWGKLVDRYSIRGQQNRIHMAERLFQAATRQANDP